ncbi:PrgI family protein [Actinomadura harenae]|uniref:PrgI family protein n=1 Tax=Actinomadura harenae TaxID=2483351 RepID=A0A3M2LHT7_9ACTN|nr:PrgI family protein [Actinomadura harenae]RMI36991.1 PrgI family protein [Actinomadura harenae]
MSIDDEYEPLVARIPADVEMPDKVLAGLTGRQLLILGATGGLVAWVYLLAQGRVPVVVIAALLIPLTALGFALALGRRDGLSLDRLALHGIRHALQGKVRVPAPEGIAPYPSWCRLRGQLPAPLDLPVRAIRQDGAMGLADGGTAVLVQAGTVSFTLRTAAEQESLVALFGRWLNSLDSPVQILIQSRSADLSDLTTELEESARDLAHPALEQAARDHAAYLDDLSRSRDLLTRRVLVVIRDQPTGETPLHRQARTRNVSATVAMRRAEDAVRALAALGIGAVVLDAEACTEVLADSLSPGQPRLGGLSRPYDLVTRSVPPTKEAR